MGYSFTLTPKDIYGVEEPTIPEGYKVVGFRPVNKGENYLTDGNWGVIFSFKEYDPGPREPRLILEKLPGKRLLEIGTCHKCAFYTSFGYCHHPETKERHVTNVTKGIPEWCPLPKAP